MRLFAAVPLDETLRKAAAEYQDLLREAGVTGNFTPKENLHITLAFIGEYDDPARVFAALHSVKFKPFTVRLDGTGRFPNLLWVGAAPRGKLEALARDVRDALAAGNIPFDRKPFRAHVTIARKTRNDAKAPSLNPGNAEMTVDRIVLMQSRLDRAGAVYTPVGIVPAAAEEET